MKKQAQIVSSVLATIAKEVKPGIMTLELEGIAQELIKAAGAKPYNLGYKPTWAPKPFPATLCTSVNNCVCHGIPTEYKLQEGDIVNLDLGIEFEGLCGDAAITVPVGEIENKNERLVRYAKRALYVGIEMIKPGVDVIDIGHAIQTYALQMGYVVNNRHTGHGIGKEMHQKPYVPHYSLLDPEWQKMFTWKLKAGDVICIEPMLTFKDPQGFRHPGDGWSILTRDGKYSAMFEHMIEVTDDGYNVLTDHFDQTLYEQN